MTELVRDKIINLPGLNGDLPVHVFASVDEAVTHVIDQIAVTLESEVASKGHALITGAGGSTPKAVYEGLSGLNLDWSKITITQVDERFVPLDNASSNTLMMATALTPAIEAGLNFVTLIQDLDDAGECAKKAEAVLRSIETADDEAIFDLTLLGMGADAHYASIFPGHAINAEIYNTTALVLPVAPSGTEAEPKLPRITLTVPALNRSKRILLLITGAEKLEVLRSAILSDDPYTSPIGAFIAQSPVPVDVVWAA
ncbi:6-phosphogluconolactonase [Asticcacaulis sp. SL142]|uniref:6-phosphogluconolactonase n=1 Tax=Asticcacaulis sp. SL142 TaxID=2995155 RepID=UPI00226CCC5B|nr:6-phosphogluconolactonase [Asticcacaulis sp. SL142]WAC47937.1 6-phosphogluconolactonase [Asticcacaulis sp. SL142]